MAGLLSCPGDILCRRGGLKNSRGGMLCRRGQIVTRRGELFNSPSAIIFRRGGDTQIYLMSPFSSRQVILTQPSKLTTNILPQ